MNMVPKWVIYKIQNLLTNEIYIGQSKNFRQRMIGHKSSRQLAVDVAIDLYGWENFSKEIIHDDIASKMEAGRWETFYIEKYNSLEPNGYNRKLQEGNTTDESAKRISKANQGKSKINNGLPIGVRRTEWGGIVTVLRINGQYTSKSFDSVEHAAQAYDKIVLYVYGPRARINYESKRQNYLESDLEKFYHFFVTKIQHSKYYGVSQSKGQWRVSIKQKNFKSFFNLSPFDKEEDAARVVDQIRLAYDLKCLKPFNFPDEISLYDPAQLKEYFDARAWHNNELRNIRVKGNSYMVNICIKGRKYSLGSFRSKEAAILARDTFLKEHGLI